MLPRALTPLLGLVPRPREPLQVRQLLRGDALMVAFCVQSTVALATSLITEDGRISKQSRVTSMGTFRGSMEVLYQTIGYQPTAKPHVGTVAFCVLLDGASTIRVVRRSAIGLRSLAAVKNLAAWQAVPMWLPPVRMTYLLSTRYTASMSLQSNMCLTQLGLFGLVV